MKKAKIMLASMALIAVLGSALAFKAKNYGATFFTGTTATSCTIQAAGITEVVGAQTYLTTASGDKNDCVYTSFLANPL